MPVHMGKRSLCIRLKNLGIPVPPYAKTTFHQLLQIALKCKVKRQEYEDLL